MKTIKFDKKLDWTESAIWTNVNREFLMNEKEKICIDFSELYVIQNNILGFLINLIHTRKLNNLEIEIIPPQGGFMDQQFKAIMEM